MPKDPRFNLILRKG